MISQNFNSAKRGHKSGQKALYNELSPLILSVCLRYQVDNGEAEDVMIKAMYKILTRLDQVKDAALLKAWAIRIAVNESLMSLRKNNLEWAALNEETMNGAIGNSDTHGADHLLFLISKMPSGYRAVFNLVELDGYTHAEAAQLLQITVGTSKSQLSRAKAWLQNKINGHG